MQKNYKHNSQEPYSTINSDTHEALPLRWWQYLMAPLGLIGATALAYYQSLNYSFQFDDVANIQKFFSIRHNSLATIAFSGPRWITCWLNSVNYRMGAFNPFSYRLFNTIIHTLAGVFIFYMLLLALSMLRNRSSFFYRNRFALATITSMLFLLHPVQTQTVSYVIQGRLEGLAGLFTFATTTCFLLFAHTKNMVTKTLCALLLFTVGFIGCGTKEIIIVMPILLLVVDWYFVAQGEWQSLKKRIGLHLAFFLLIMGTYLYFMKPAFFTNILSLKTEARNNIGNVLTESPTEKITPLHFFISQFKVILHYIFIFFWPFGISVEYDWKLSAHFFTPDSFLPFLVLVGIAACIIVLLRRNKTDLVTFATLWFFITVAPRSSIIPSSELMADYKTYVPSFGILFLIASALVYCFNAFSSKQQHFLVRRSYVHCCASFLLAAMLGFATYQRNKVWRSASEFWSNIIENAPGKARAYNNLGVALSEQGKIQESVPLYKKAIAMDPNYPDPCNNLAVAYSILGKTNLAIETLKHAIKIQPYYPEAYNNLASFYISQKNYDMAEKMLKIALQLRPHYGKAFFNYGKLNMEKGNFDQALACFKDACTKGDLDNETGFTVYAQAAFNLKKWDDAIGALTNLMRIKPLLSTEKKLAYSYMNNNNHVEALKLYNHITTQDQTDPETWYYMAECYLHTNEPKQALALYQRAQQMHLPFQQLDLRIAVCFEKLGQVDQAKMILQNYVTKDVPLALKHAAQQVLTALNKQKSNTTTQQVTQT